MNMDTALDLQYGNKTRKKSNETCCANIHSVVWEHLAFQNSSLT